MHVGVERGSAAKFKVVRTDARGVLLGGVNEATRHRGVRRNGAAVIDERHRAHDAPEDPAACEHQWQDADQRIAVARLEKARFVAEVLFIQPLPAMTVVKTARRLRFEKRIPLLARCRGSGVVDFKPHPVVPPRYEMNERFRGKYICDRSPAGNESFQSRGGPSEAPFAIWGRSLSPSAFFIRVDLF